MGRIDGTKVRLGIDHAPMWSTKEATHLAKTVSDTFSWPFDGEAVSVEGLKHLDEATAISRFVSVASRQDDDTMPRWRPQQHAHLQLNTFVNVLFLAGHAPPLANIEPDSSSLEVLFDRGALVH